MIATTSPRLWGRLIVPALLVLLLPGCSTNSQGDEAAPVYLAVEIRDHPFLKNVGLNGSGVQVQTMNIFSRLKAPDLGQSNFWDARLTDYEVTWTRIDGGSKAPAKETFSVSSFVPVGGQASLNNYPIMSPSAVQAPPLDQLLPFNGGVDRETGQVQIRCRATIIFYGHFSNGVRVATIPTTTEMNFFFAATGAAQTR